MGGEVIFEAIGGKAETTEKAVLCRWPAWLASHNKCAGLPSNNMASE